MPNGRRKVPFSGKAKKMQLQMKKERQRISQGIIFILIIYFNYVLYYYVNRKIKDI